MGLSRLGLPSVLLCGCSALTGLSQYSEQESSTKGGTSARPDSGTVDAATGDLEDTSAGDASTEDPDESSTEADPGTDDASDDAVACSGALTSCPSGCANVANDTSNCGACGTACTTAVSSAQATCGDGGCGFACNAGYTLCGGVCVDFQTDNSNCGGCGASFACASGQGCQSGSCAGCTTVNLPPSVNVDVTQWETKFATSPTWNCNASGTTTIDSNAGTVTSTSLFARYGRRDERRRAAGIERSARDGRALAGVDGHQRARPRAQGRQAHRPPRRGERARGSRRRDRRGRDRKDRRTGLASPVAASFGSGGVTRAHGGASGGSEGCSCNPETSADNGQDGHATDDVAASGGHAVDTNAATGAKGGLCAGAGCASASAVDGNGMTSQASNSGSGGGGGGGRIQVIASPVTTACN